MPFKITTKPAISHWSKVDELANKNGYKRTIFFVNGDNYIGEWKNNKKHGRGVYKWKKSGQIYEGEWEDDVRHGSGVLSVESKNGTRLSIYCGEWKFDKQHGYGYRYYSVNEHYEGEWYDDKRCGWGRMFYKDGSIYEGFWEDDQRSGNGMLRLRNWKNDKKNGNGKYFFVRTGQLMQGVWIDDTAKCCQMTDLGRETAKSPTESEIPKIHLADPDGVLRSTQEQLLNLVNP